MMPPNAICRSGILPGQSAETSAAYTLPRPSSGRRASRAGSETFAKDAAGTRIDPMIRASPGFSARHTTGAAPGAAPSWAVNSMPCGRM